MAELDFPREQFEVVVVDNNSTDDTPGVAHQFRDIGIALKYVKETRLSFTVARHTGADTSSGRVLSYIDDDVVVDKGWLTAVIDAFDSDEAVGVVGGPILPIFETEPPDWIKKYYPMSGWLSLMDRGSELHQTNDAYGPNFSVRKDVLNLVGGFPPDTIGVESEGRPGVVEKIYIGSGDVGLCAKVEKVGYKIIYAPGALTHHVIPPVRLTKKWWHSRLAGEACYLAITNQHEHHHKSAKLLLKSLYALAKTAKTATYRIAALFMGKPTEPHEFRLSFFLSRAKTQFALARRPDLADRLWEIGLSGVWSDDYKELLRLLTWR